MFGKFRQDETTIYDDPITRVLTEMDEYGPNTPEYSALMRHLEELSKIRTDHRRRRISPDTMIIVAGNLLGILVIVAYEQKHVMTSKGLGFIKPKEPHI